MNDHRSHAQEFEQHRVGGKQAGDGLLAHGVAAIFDDDRFPVMDLDKREGFGQGTGGGPTRLFGAIGQ